MGVEKVLPFNFKLNYFELFDLPESFAIDLKLLRERMRELQKQCHPDRFINSTPQEKRDLLYIYRIPIHINTF